MLDYCCYAADILPLFNLIRKSMAIETPTTEDTCLNPHCESAPAARGLCRACYASAKTLVNQGGLTWEALEAAGKCLPSVRKRPAVSRTAWLREGLSA